MVSDMAAKSMLNTLRKTKLRKPDPDSPYATEPDYPNPSRFEDWLGPPIDVPRFENSIVSKYKVDTSKKIVTNDGTTIYTSYTVEAGPASKVANSQTTIVNYIDNNMASASPEQQATLSKFKNVLTGSAALDETGNVAAGAGVVPSLDTLMNSTDLSTVTGFGSIAAGSIAAIGIGLAAGSGSIMGTAAQGFTNHTSTMVSQMSNLTNMVNARNGLSNFFDDPVDSLCDTFMNVLGSILGLGLDLLNGIAGILNSIVDAILGGINAVVEAILAALEPILSIMRKIFNTILNELLNLIQLGRDLLDFALASILGVLNNPCVAMVVNQVGGPGIQDTYSTLTSIYNLV